MEDEFEQRVELLIILLTDVLLALDNFLQPFDELPRHLAVMFHLLPDQLQGHKVGLALGGHLIDYEKELQTLGEIFLLGLFLLRRLYQVQHHGVEIVGREDLGEVLLTNLPNTYALEDLLED